MTDFRNFLEHLYHDAIESEGQARKREKSHMISAELAADAALIHQRHKEQLYEALTLFDEKSVERSSASSARCPDCVGTGWDDAADDACEACQGDGWVLEEPEAPHARWPKCPDCDGTGWEADLIDAYAEVCTTCDGDGYLPAAPASWDGASVTPNIMHTEDCTCQGGSGPCSCI